MAPVSLKVKADIMRCIHPMICVNEILTHMLNGYQSIMLQGLVHNVFRTSYVSAAKHRMECRSVGCRYNAVQYDKILHNGLHELRQNINQMLDTQIKFHTSP